MLMLKYDVIYPDLYNVVVRLCRKELLPNNVKRTHPVLQSPQSHPCKEEETPGIVRRIVFLEGFRFELGKVGMSHAKI